MRTSSSRVAAVLFSFSLLARRLKKKSVQQLTSVRVIRNNLLMRMFNRSLDI